jgi:2-amino-4-hydroxy-6-hydroxymethyldihydropteridine diphosphokinase
VTAYISLGANLGEPRRQLGEALDRLAREPSLRVSALSSLYRTGPVGHVPQPPFLNAAAALDTALAPREVLDVLLRAEQAMGRERRERWGPRLIDLDLLLHEEFVLEEPGLTLPHPHMHERRFVLAPLAEIAPGAVHPLLRKTAAQLLAALGKGGGWAERLEERWWGPGRAPG